MAIAGFCNLRTTPLISCSATPQSNNPKPYPNNKPSSSSSSANWWAPLFGWSSDPDYINRSSTTTPAAAGGIAIEKKSESSQVDRSTRFALGSFTYEKAKELRKMTRETSTFHDVMYHSAIASRLAYDLTESKEG